jgi:hypothetical protein
MRYKSGTTLVGNDLLGIVAPIGKGRINMAERKSALKRAPARPELERLLQQAKTAVVSDDQLKVQRASFIYGNAPNGSRITKDSAQRAVHRIRVASDV